MHSEPLPAPSLPLVVQNRIFKTTVPGETDKKRREIDAFEFLSRSHAEIFRDLLDWNRTDKVCGTKRVIARRYLKPGPPFIRSDRSFDPSEKAIPLPINELTARPYI